MKLQQQQQQLISMEGFDGSRVRILLSKLINVVLALLAVILVLLHTTIHLVGPFLNTRLRTFAYFISFRLIYIEDLLKFETQSIVFARLL